MRFVSIALVLVLAGCGATKPTLESDADAGTS